MVAASRWSKLPQPTAAPRRVDKQVGQEAGVRGGLTRLWVGCNHTDLDWLWQDLQYLG